MSRRKQSTTRKTKPVTGDRYWARSRPAEAKIKLASGEAQDPENPGAITAVVRNVAEHPLSYMHNAGQITGVQLYAGEQFRRYFEMAGIGGARAIDYSKAKVDGGVVSDPLSDKLQDANTWLRDVARSPDIGNVSYRLLQAICGEGKRVKEVAVAWEGAIALRGRRAEGYISGRLREALDGLAKHLRLDGNPRSRRRVSFDPVSGPSREWEPGIVAGDMVEKPRPRA